MESSVESAHEKPAPELPVLSIWKKSVTAAPPGAAAPRGGCEHDEGKGAPADGHERRVHDTAETAGSAASRSKEGTAERMARQRQKF